MLKRRSIGMFLICIKKGSNDISNQNMTYLDMPFGNNFATFLLILDPRKVIRDKSL